MELPNNNNNNNSSNTILIIIVPNLGLVNLSICLMCIRDRFYFGRFLCSICIFEILQY